MSEFDVEKARSLSGRHPGAKSGQRRTALREACDEIDRLRRELYASDAWLRENKPELDRLRAANADLSLAANDRLKKLGGLQAKVAELERKLADSIALHAADASTDALLLYRAEKRAEKLREWIEDFSDFPFSVTRATEELRRAQDLARVALAADSATPCDACDQAPCICNAVLECRACSEAGGAGLAVKHLPPLCPYDKARGKGPT